MLLLLDTHVFLWLITGDSRFPSRFYDAFVDPENKVYLSAASLWEITIKYDLGKLPLPEPPETYVPRQRKLHRIESLAITETGLTNLASLPNLHRDPFDRCLISQALGHGMTIVTTDQEIIKYSVPILK